MKESKSTDRLFKAAKKTKQYFYCMEKNPLETLKRKSYEDQQVTTGNQSQFLNLI